MDVKDEELVGVLEVRDGPLGSRWRLHRRDGICGFGDLYPNDDCPWCEAEAHRQPDPESRSAEA